MAFSDGFAKCMSDANIPVTADSVNVDGTTLKSVVDYLRQSVTNFGDYAKGLDEMTTPAEPASIALSDSSVGAIDAAYNWLLYAFDAASGIPISTALDWCDYCIQQANQAS